MACYGHECGVHSAYGVSTPAFPWPTNLSTPTNLPHEFSISDHLKLPADLSPGDYVLGWR
jgi:hypothetical protein